MLLHPVLFAAGLQHADDGIDDGAAALHDVHVGGLHLGRQQSVQAVPQPADEVRHSRVRREGHPALQHGERPARLGELAAKEEQREVWDHGGRAQVDAGALHLVAVDQPAVRVVPHRGVDGGRVRLHLAVLPGVEGVELPATLDGGDGREHAGAEHRAQKVQVALILAQPRDGLLQAAAAAPAALSPRRLVGALAGARSGVAAVGSHAGMAAGQKPDALQQLSELGHHVLHHLHRVH
mmetsp:Transcript_37664/g.95189  ORF Transcript_37664/g.95189 Transcript_37664/m.95189 type:complete len:237 (+) Transcript_37664:196-906(+)